MFKILTLNPIANAGLKHLSPDRYEVGSEMTQPHAILLRSFNVHDYPLPATLLAVGRAGAGVNNIPVGKLSQGGIPVFNAPGANANSVKELVLAGMLLAARHICFAWQFAMQQTTKDAGELSRCIEGNKKQFVGFELRGRTLGVLGLGAIGIEVANAAIALGMRVVGYDLRPPQSHAQQLSSSVLLEESIEGVLRQADILTLHIPLNSNTQGLINWESMGWMKAGATLLNFSRPGIVHEQSLIEALRINKLNAYVCDFPSVTLLGIERVTVLPHIGASTQEAEENCAKMVVTQLKQFLEDGNIENSVNFPDISLPRNSGYRVSIANKNVPNMVGQISSVLADTNLNILDMINKSQGELAYNLIDLDQSLELDILYSFKSHPWGVIGAQLVNGDFADALGAKGRRQDAPVIMHPATFGLYVG